MRTTTPAPPLPVRRVCGNGTPDTPKSLQHPFTNPLDPGCNILAVDGEAGRAQPPCAATLPCRLSGARRTSSAGFEGLERVVTCSCAVVKWVRRGGRLRPGNARIVTACGAAKFTDKESSLEHDRSVARSRIDHGLSWFSPAQPQRVLGPAPPCSAARPLAGDAAKSAIINEYRREMLVNSRLLMDFLRTYSAARLDDSFADTFQIELLVIGSALVQRIEREQSTPFPLYQAPTES